MVSAPLATKPPAPVPLLPRAIPARDAPHRRATLATVENHLTLGATWTLANKSELTVSYMHAFENKVTGVSTGQGAGPAGAGVIGHPVDLKMHQNAIGVAYGWKM